MTIATRMAGTAMLVALLHGLAPSVAAQTAAPERVILTPEQMEKFLLEAKILKSRPSGSGTTGTLILTLSDGTVTHEAQAQFIDIEQAIYKAQGGYTEFNFRDFFGFNIAAYELAVLLDIDNVPMSVERRVGGKRAAVTWYVDDVAMTEEGRRKNEAADPNVQRFQHYQYRQRVFDELIQNRDRNLGNTIYTKEWTTWMVDHTRAFRLNKDLGRPAELIRVERTLYDNLKKLTAASLTAAVGKQLRKAEVEAVIARRDAIIKAFDARIAKSGEAAVLYTYP